MPSAGVLRIAPIAGETTWSYLSLLADRYGLEPGALLPLWTWTGSRPRDEIGPREDAEVLLNRVGRRLLDRLGGADEQDLARALPSFGDGPRPVYSGTPAGPAPRGTRRGLPRRLPAGQMARPPAQTRRPRTAARRAGAGPRRSRPLVEPGLADGRERIRSSVHGSLPPFRRAPWSRLPIHAAD